VWKINTVESRPDGTRLGDVAQDRRAGNRGDLLGWCKSELRISGVSSVNEKQDSRPVGVVSVGPYEACLSVARRSSRLPAVASSRSGLYQSPLRTSAAAL
jgi:hypothetical protein